MKTITLFLTLPDGTKSRPIHILKDAHGNPHAAPSNREQGSPMTEAEADEAVDYLTRTIDGSIAVINEYRQPKLARP